MCPSQKHFGHCTFFQTCAACDHFLVHVNDDTKVMVPLEVEIPSDEQTSLLVSWAQPEVFHFQCWKESDVNPHYLLKMYHLLKMYLLLTYGTS